MDTVSKPRIWIHRLSCLGMKTVWAEDLDVVVYVLYGMMGNARGDE